MDEIAGLLNKPVSSIASLVELLRARGLVEILEEEKLYATTTSEGRQYLKALPEERVVEVLKQRGGEAPIRDLEQVLGKNIVSIGIGWAKKRGWIVIEKGIAKLVREGSLEEHRKLLSMFLERREVPQDVSNSDVFKELVQRKLIVVERVKVKHVKIREDRLELAKKLLELGEGVSHLTHELIASGRWRYVKLKPYNVEALPPIKIVGKKHPLKEFIEMVREIMLSLGFEEVRDDYVVPEFWNFDALFQAQDHPSRDIHDVLFVPGYADLSTYKDVVERAKQVHETGGSCGSIGWGYRWSYEKASKLLLRSHTTAVTIKWLYLRKTPPVRIFTIGKVFRRDSIDSRHLPEFTNFDGVVMEKDFNFKKLLGLLEQIVRGLGITKLRFKPSYFPFTEPSVEGYVYVEGYGWIEAFGAGMFRPEVLEIVGVKHPVGAWGMGLERLAMALMGVNDIRVFYTRDVEQLRSWRRSDVLRCVKRARH